MFVGHFSPPGSRIRTANPDPNTDPNTDPGTPLNPDPIRLRIRIYSTALSVQDTSTGDIYRDRR